MTTATKEVIEKAYQKANEQGGDYRLTFRGGNEWTVTHTGGKSEYGVLTCEGDENCTCKAFEYDGFCKHLALCLESERYDAQGKATIPPIDCEEIDILRPVIKLATIERDADLIDPYYVAPTRREDTGEWPSCTLHGPYRAFDGRPDLDCWKCEKLRS